MTLVKLRLKRPPIRYPDDVAYLVKLMASRGCEVDPYDAEAAWREYCGDQYAAGWIKPEGHPESMIVFVIRSKCEEVTA